MATLITMNKSWHQEPWLYERRFLASKGDTILLLEDAVLSLHSPLALGSFLAKCQADEIQVCAMADDVKARGVTVAHDGVVLIDHRRFVELAVEHETQVAW